MKIKQWQKDALCLAGMMVLDGLTHVVTAQDMIQTRRSVVVSSMSDRELEIESKGKREHLPLIIRNSNHLAIIWESLKNGKKIDLVLKCVVSKPHTKPTMLKAEILEVKIAV
jgi:hypothetical protein